MFEPSDLLLYIQSPFASWLERLSVEEPDHGIPTDITSALTEQTADRDYLGDQDFLNQLVTQGMEYFLVDDWLSEPERRVRTLEAMREGVDFILRAQLLVAPFYGRIDILMKVAGKSVLGDYHYVPGEVRSGDMPPAYAPVSLCCYAEMLESLQCVLPQQLILVLMGPAGLQLHRLDLADHMPFYQAQEYRFLVAQDRFSPDKMPDPGSSKHWGRWSRYAEHLRTEIDNSRGGPLT